jgi:hypothetical protein
MGNIANVEVSPFDVTWGASGIGFIEGDIDLSFVEDLVDVTTHQTGTNVLSAIRTGKSVEVSLTLKETDTAKIQYLMGAAGTVDNASGATADVLGWGTAKDFTQVLTQAEKLVFHPVKLAAGDRSKDYAFWKAYPVPGSFVASGENNNTFSVTFRIFPDASKAKAFEYGVRGDHTVGNFASVGA